MILGLDISTSTVGFTLLNLTGGVIHMGYVKPLGDNMFSKVESAFDLIDTVVQSNIFRDSYRPLIGIYAEAPNIMFKAGFSSAQVLSTILRFNGSLLFTIYKKFNILPIEAMAVSMRKQVIGKGRFAKGTDTKSEVFKWVQSQPECKSVNWPTIEKGKNKGNHAPECFDMADSYIVAMFGLQNEKIKTKENNAI